MLSSSPPIYMYLHTQTLDRCFDVKNIVEKMWLKNWRFLFQILLGFAKNGYFYCFFLGNAIFFAENLQKITENCHHQIALRKDSK
jgi:hypothetical protein